MDVPKWSFTLVEICAILLITSCGVKTAADAEPVVDQEAGIVEKEEVSKEIPADSQPVPEITEWQTAVGEWVDQNGLGYVMQVSVNEAETDMLFSVSFAPRAVWNWDGYSPVNWPRTTKHFIMIKAS